MRVTRLLLLLTAPAVLAACAQQRPPQYYAASPVYPPNYQAPQRQAYPPRARPDLDMMVYGAPAAYPQQRPMYAQPRPVYAPPPIAYQPVPAPSRTVRVASQYVPVRDEGPYTLDTGDKLRIVVFGQDTLSNTYTVDAAGMVTMPLIGAVAARDMTTSALGAAIRAKLAGGFIREPSVAVEVDIYRPFFVLGEVTYPGQYPFVPHMTVENAIAIAGGFTPRATKSTVTVTRKMQGVPYRFEQPVRTPIRPGDVVTVSERWF